ALAVRLTEPSNHVPKTYHVTIRGVPTEEALEKLRRGIPVLGKRTKSIQLRIIQQNRQTTLVEMILTEGRNRQIRRMWQAVGHRVRRLVRVAIGAFALGNLKPGEWRFLGCADVQNWFASPSSLSFPSTWQSGKLRFFGDATICK